MAPARSALGRQTMTLVMKDFKILLQYHAVSTIYAALALPVVMTVYLGIGATLNDRSEYGIGEPRPILSLQDGLAAADGSRNTVVFAHNGEAPTDVQTVIDSVSDQVSAAGKESRTLTDVSELGEVCRASYQGTTPCYGAVVFHSSPDAGGDAVWNYTLRADSALGTAFEIKDENNDAQVYTLPLQRAVDAAIASANSSNNDGDTSSSLESLEEYPFTDETEDEREARARRDYQNTFVNYMGVAMLLSLMGVVYHLPGNIATEREAGLSQLMDAMMASNYDWEPQVARILAYIFSFTSIYSVGWIVAGVIAKALIWRETSVGITLIFFVLAGNALTSQGVLGGTFFKKAQLSGIVNFLVYILLGVLAQALPDPHTAVVAVLGFLFTPCTCIFFIRDISRFEGEGRAMNLLEAPPTGSSELPGIVLWVFLGVQFVVYPVLAVMLERLIHGVASESRTIYKGQPSASQPQDAVHIQGMTKIYRPGFLRRLFSFVSKPRDPTVAVDNLTLTAKRGQILALLGANGSGKSTTLDIVSGMNRSSSGSVNIDASEGIGIAPQKNVLWEDLTVVDHVKIFNALKSRGRTSNATEIDELIASVGLSAKKNSQAKTLSGGQKRKLQLGLMLTGGSAVCCVDEVSSGIDPLSRRKIWDILLSERGRRTIIMTTHFLDEADLLADNIAILSKGALRAEGSSVALKQRMGAGYRIHVSDTESVRNLPEVPGVHREFGDNTITYVSPSSDLTANAIRALEQASIPYRLSSPTIEDVFLQVAEEAKGEEVPAPGSNNRAPLARADNSNDSRNGLKEKAAPQGESSSYDLQSGRPVSFFKQTGVLVYKRFTLFKSNWTPYVAAFLIPVVAAAIMQLLVRGEDQVGCAVGDQSQVEGLSRYNEVFDDVFVAAGPSSELSSSVIDNLFDSVAPQGVISGGGDGSPELEVRDSFSNLQTFIEDNRKEIFPGGWWLGGEDQPETVIYRADNARSIYNAVFAQNMLNALRTNTTIVASYASFDSPVAASTTDSLLLAIFFSIVLAVAPAFFGLYPNVERRTGVRGLQYSSGVRSLQLWASHLAFDFGIFLVALVVAAIILVTSSDIWYSPGHLFPVFIMFGITAVCLSYIFSLFFGSQLATFAAVMAYNGVGFAIYIISFLFIISLSPVTLTERNVLIAHFVVSVFFPVGSVCRAMFVGLNVFSTTCSGDQLEGYPGAITAYGGPILYLTLQAVLCFSVLVWNDAGSKLPSFISFRRRTKKRAPSVNEPSDADMDTEVAEELLRVENSSQSDGLQVKHLTKSFGKHTAVDNVTFGVGHGEVLALLGPNGAGKSTTISVIRGDLPPDRGPGGGDVLVERASVLTRRAQARGNLGVCPQTDALDPSMTVTEHLLHYARLRGVADPERQVEAVVRSVGLDARVDAPAGHLSGGNKRKLSLGIALTGNPRVLLLDEPSSGLDAAAKRVMWRTLAALVPGRSVLLTTHSMEEADALANRAAILAKRVLAVGEVEGLLRRFGDSLYVHLVAKTAPHSTSEEMDRMRETVLDLFPEASIEQETYHGQMRFSVPASSVLERNRQSSAQPDAEDDGPQEVTGHSEDADRDHDRDSEAGAIGQLIVALEENKEALGIEHHSVNTTTLNDVFLSIVGRHKVQEEGYEKAGDGNEKKPWYKHRIIRLMFGIPF